MGKDFDSFKRWCASLDVVVIGALDTYNESFIVIFVCAEFFTCKVISRL